MENNITFTYNYSSSENKEIQEIRKKYMPQEESPFEELKRLDCTVQNAGIQSSLIIGLGSCLIFGFALCMTLGVIGNGLLITLLGILLGIAGIAGMIAAYPVYRFIYNKTKAELTPRILQLVNELDEINI